MPRLLHISLWELAIVLSFWANVGRAELLVGTATVDITPPLPVAVTGQFALRIAREAETPLTANIVAFGIAQRVPTTRCCRDGFLRLDRHSGRLVGDGEATGPHSGPRP